MAEILAELLPDNNWGKIGIFLIFAFVLLVITRRFHLEWIGIFVRHIFRWLRCKIRNKHHWRQASLFGSVNIETGRYRGDVVCRVCGKTERWR